MVQPTPQVFLSYHRADHAVAERLCAHLVANRVTTWMDQYDIRPGAYWPDEIDKGLTQSQVVVGLLSPEAVESRNVKNEWDWALQNDKQLILLMVRPCVIPHRYVSINFIDATGDELKPALDSVLRVLGLQPAPAELPVPQTRYARSGDVSIAYLVFGDGPVDLVLVPGYVSHCEHAWKLPAFATFLRRLASFSRVLLFDKRGTGMSDRVASVSTLEERMDDIRAVMDACRSERAVIAGVSEGVPLAVLFAATYPERTHALVLYGGQATYAQQSDYPWPQPREERERTINERAKTLYERWGTMSQAREIIATEMVPSKQDDDELVQWFAELLRLSASPGAEIARQRMNLSIDVRHVLPVIRVPTLVINRTHDLNAPIEEARYIAARIPGALLAELPGDEHFYWEGDQESFFTAVERFVTDPTLSRTVADERDTVLATVVAVAADGSDATDLRTSLGRDIERYRGRILSTADGGMVAVFDGPARALRYANTISTAARSVNASVRCGVQTGEMEIDDQRASGSPVDIARRLAGMARADQILTTGTVQDLVAGSSIRFAPAPAALTGKMPETARVLVAEPGSLT